MQKIENCPVCEKPLEEWANELICHMCDVRVNPVTGEIKRNKPKKAIIKNILGKIKTVLLS